MTGNYLQIKRTEKITLNESFSGLVEIHLRGSDD